MLPIRTGVPPARLNNWTWIPPPATGTKDVTVTWVDCADWRIEGTITGVVGAGNELTVTVAEPDLAVS